jgi:hypothetical protein
LPRQRSAKIYPPQIYQRFFSKLTLNVASPTLIFVKKRSQSVLNGIHMVGKIVLQ